MFKDLVVIYMDICHGTVSAYSDKVTEIGLNLCKPPSKNESRFSFLIPHNRLLHSSHYFKIVFKL